MINFDPERVIRCTGYFNDASDVPAYDPGPTAPCPVCDKPLGALNEKRTKARSLWVVNDRSHFFYYHTDCAHDAAKIDAFESAVVDQIVEQEKLQ